MSDRLAVSASVSVLMMSIYVLFGADLSRFAVSPGELRAPAALTVPVSLAEPERMFRISQ